MKLHADFLLGLFFDPEDRDVSETSVYLYGVISEKVQHIFDMCAKKYQM
jgi:hypothetical protein